MSICVYLRIPPSPESTHTLRQTRKYWDIPGLGSPPQESLLSHWGWKYLDFKYHLVLMYLLNTKCKVIAAYFIGRTLSIVYRLNLTCVVLVPFQRSDKCLYCIKLGPNIISETCSGSTCIEAEVYGKPDSQGSSTEKFSYHRFHITAWLPVDEPIQWRRPYCLPSIPQQLVWGRKYF